MRSDTWSACLESVVTRHALRVGFVKVIKVELQEVRDRMLPRIDALIQHGESGGIDCTPLKNVRVFAEQATSKRELYHVVDVIEAFANALPDD